MTMIYNCLFIYTMVVAVLSHLGSLLEVVHPFLRYTPP